MSNFCVLSKSNSCFSDEVLGDVSGDVDKVVGEVVNRNEKSYKDGDDEEVGWDDRNGQLYETFVPRVNNNPFRFDTIISKGKKEKGMSTKEVSYKCTTKDPPA